MADSTAKSDDPRDRAQSVFLRTIASEHRELFGRSAKLAAEISTYSDKPVVVIASGKSNPAFGEVAEEFQRYWIEQSHALAGKFPKGRFVLAEGASHYLYQDAPDLVEESILSVVRAARAE